MVRKQTANEVNVMFSDAPLDLNIFAIAAVMSGPKSINLKQIHVLGFWHNMSGPALCVHKNSFKQMKTVIFRAFVELKTHICISYSISYQ